MSKRIVIFKNGESIYTEEDVWKLLEKGESSVYEDELKNILKRYNLKEALITLGETSRYIAHERDPNIIGIGVIKEPKINILISQFTLSYIANIFLISGANDYKHKIINGSNNHTWAVLCNICSNCLIMPELKKGHSFNEISFFIRMHFEQFQYQFTPLSIISRAIIIFNDLANQITPKKFKRLTDIFEEENGISLLDYYKIAMAIWSLTKIKSTFKIENFTDATIPSMKGVLKKEKIKNFLNISSTDYRKFRDFDKNSNQGLNPIYTKTRKNTLQVYPIVEFDDKRDLDKFVIPNVPAFAINIFEGIFWWFQNYFERQGEKESGYFRDYIGVLFQEYVGVLLKGTYGEKNVFSEIKYGKGGNNKFFDWTVKRGNKRYCFEVKARQFSMKTKQTGEMEFVKKEIGIMTAAIKQCFNNFNDILKYKELSDFKKTENIPIIVFKDIPFISSGLYKKLIDSDLMEMVRKDKKLKGIENFKVYLMNVEELESYNSLVDIVDIEDVFSGIEGQHDMNFKSFVIKKTGSARNKILDNKYIEFWKELTGKDLE